MLAAGLVVDNWFELKTLARLAEQQNQQVPILLRVTPRH